MPRDPMEPYVKMTDAGMDLLGFDEVPVVRIQWEEIDEPGNLELIELHEREITLCIAELKGVSGESESRGVCAA